MSATRNSGSVSTILAGSARSGRLVGWQQLGAIAAVYLVYLASRQLGQLGMGRAVDNARSVAAAESWLGIGVEEAVRAWLVDVPGLLMPTNLFYLGAHWPLVGGVAFWLYRRHSDGFRILRNAMFGSAAIAFVVFAAFPVAPPRFAVAGARDTVVEDASWLRDILQPADLMNEIAAMPSMHFGWNLLVCLAVVRYASGRAVRVAAVVIPVIMAFAVIATANHYLLDVVAGALLCVGAWTIAGRRTLPKSEATARNGRSAETSLNQLSSRP